MAKSNQTEGNDASADVKADGFYPEDAMDRNFADARRTAVENHEQDVANRSVGATGGDTVVDAKPVDVINPVAGPAPRGTDPVADETK